ncbi:flagellar protein FlgN [Alkaliphilus sp. MSJ-5]|uniref:Flagellar protein FlgN n=1 Tax=Alkaliphilus flagellatus TaxID=2841507 RepID=A0ABS6G2F2_9FIRM|nr:flagellar protein FlgN [Alkaliphilus flagellatus]MBU5676655.1 flagellar protein FlgN [Alkaliphilus flagellatus]
MKSIDQLKDTLIKETDLYTQVLKLAEEKTKVIVAGDIKVLEDITKKEQQYIMNMGTFEKIRRSILTNIAEELNVEAITTVSELILFVEEDAGNKIDQLRNNLLETIADLKVVNEGNEKLINQSLQYINFNLEVLTHSPEDGNRYSSNASENKEVKPINFFDMRV